MRGACLFDTAAMLRNAISWPRVLDLSQIDRYGFVLSFSMEGWQLFTRYLIKNHRRVARNCFIDGLHCVSGRASKLSLQEVKGEIEVFILQNTNRN